MTDVFDKAKRSQVMSRIRGHGNKATELLLASVFRRHAIKGWRRNQPVFGKPDFTFRTQKLAVFVDGCFWHGCPRHCKMPSGNAAFWRKKLHGNKARDRIVNCTLRQRGWKVVRIWECTLEKAVKERREEQILRRIRSRLQSREGPVSKPTRAQQCEG
jgi:DNA mismatch endonuclease (patch repair protein)